MDGISEFSESFFIVFCVKFERADFTALLSSCEEKRVMTSVEVDS
jgi:hypothetical protein